MKTPDQRASSIDALEVGVAVIPLPQMVPPQRPATPGTEKGVPGFEETRGGTRPRSPDKPPFLIQKGEDAVQAATEAIARQIRLVTERISASVADQIAARPVADGLDLESVSVSFGISLMAGVQTLFTAQGESSVQVTITLGPCSASTDRS